MSIYENLLQPGLTLKHFDPTHVTIRRLTYSRYKAVCHYLAFPHDSMCEGTFYLTHSLFINLPFQPKSARGEKGLLLKNKQGIRASAGVSEKGLCPYCGEIPYGLMINCSGCARQHHSSCVPSEERMGKGLSTVFRCSECNNEKQ